MRWNRRIEVEFHDLESIKAILRDATNEMILSFTEEFFGHLQESSKIVKALPGDEKISNTIEEKTILSFDVSFKRNHWITYLEVEMKIPGLSRMDIARMGHEA